MAQKTYVVTKADGTKKKVKADRFVQDGMGTRFFGKDGLVASFAEIVTVETEGAVEDVADA